MREDGVEGWSEKRERERKKGGRVWDEEMEGRPIRGREDLSADDGCARMVRGRSVSSLPSLYYSLVGQPPAPRQRRGPAGIEYGSVSRRINRWIIFHGSGSANFGSKGMPDPDGHPLMNFLHWCTDFLLINLIT